MTEAQSPRERWRAHVAAAKLLTDQLRSDSSSTWRRLREVLGEERCDAVRGAIAEAPVSMGAGRFATKSLCLDRHAFKFIIAKQPRESDSDPLDFLVEERFILRPEEFGTYGWELSVAAQVLFEEGGEIDPIEYLSYFVSDVDAGFRRGRDVLGVPYPRWLSDCELDPAHATLFLVTASDVDQHSRELMLLDMDGRVMRVLEAQPSRAETSTIEPLSQVEAQEEFGPWLEAAQRVAAAKMA